MGKSRHKRHGETPEKKVMRERYEKILREREDELRKKLKPRDPVEIDAAKHWYVAYTDPRGERRAGEALTDAGVAIYLPTERVKIAHARKIVDAERPFFTRYVFFGFPPQDKAFGVARSCDGVHSLLGVGGSPLRIPALMLELIELRMRDKAAAWFRDVQKNLRPRGANLDFTIGQSSRIERGPFVGFYAQVEALVGATHVRALLKQFADGDAIVPSPITLPVELLQAA